MIPEIGQFALVLALALACAQAFLPLAGTALGKHAWTATARPVAVGQFLFVLLAWAALATSFVNNDFSVANVAHMFTGMEITDKGVGLMGDYVAQIREVVGWEVPLCADHFGHLGVNSCIRLGKGLEKYNLAWLEDMIPWTETELWKQITNAVNIPCLLYTSPSPRD